MEKKYTLPKEFGEKWIAALRSGKFTQSKNRLKDDKGYCCLGVGCIINGHDDREIYGLSYPSKTLMPDGIFEDPELGAYSTLETVLSRMNDHEGRSFPEIANWIEQNVELT